MVALPVSHDAFGAPSTQLAGQALHLAQMIADEQPRLLIENGSGVSTLVAAYAFQKLGRGRVVALEHDPDRAKHTRALIAQHGLKAFATVIEAAIAA